MKKRVGFSNLIDGKELPKSDYHFEVLGNLDECSAALALVRSYCDNDEDKKVFKAIQKDLSLLMGQIAGVAFEEDFFDERLVWIEALISDLKQSVTLPKGFILPGENKTEAHLDFARAIARRAERSLAHLVELKDLPDRTGLQYLNRISTVLYLYEVNVRNLAG